MKTVVAQLESRASANAWQKTGFDPKIHEAERALGADLHQEQFAFARAATREAVCAWWNALRQRYSQAWPLAELPDDVRLASLPADACEYARNFGTQLASSSDASYLIGCYYTSLLPEGVQARLGAYYTPPALCERLLDLASEEGINWRSARVLDPACGGGAFLSPIARRMANGLGKCDARLALKSILQRLRGFELDPFAAWLSRVFLEATLEDIFRTRVSANDAIEICDSLKRDTDGNDFDLVIGNPPYGRVTLAPELRQKYRRSLYGHANLYGVFTDLAVRLCRRGGVIAYVTPTSFLAGEYFKALRGLICREAPPASLDFITARKGVFAEVLQETLLAVYRRGANPGVGQVHFVSLTPNGNDCRSRGVRIANGGLFRLPTEVERPWLVPRSWADNDLVQTAEHMPHRLSHFGYQVSTGPLVWNRHKAGLREECRPGRYPLIWAESVRPDGRFQFRALNRSHRAYFEPLPRELWVLTSSECVLVQRTTAKEQDRRLIAAELPRQFIRKHGAVVVENHLNMIRAEVGGASISPAAIAAVLNTAVVDRLFRCINGSVAVSAYELESLPLPSPGGMRQIERLITSRAPAAAIERTVARLYGESAR